MDALGATKPRGPLSAVIGVLSPAPARPSGFNPRLGQAEPRSPARRTSKRAAGRHRRKRVLPSSSPPPFPPPTTPPAPGPGPGPGPSRGHPHQRRAPAQAKQPGAPPQAASRGRNVPRSPPAAPTDWFPPSPSILHDTHPHLLGPKLSAKAQAGQKRWEGSAAYPVRKSGRGGRGPLLSVCRRWRCWQPQGQRPPLLPSQPRRYPLDDGDGGPRRQRTPPRLTLFTLGRFRC